MNQMLKTQRTRTPVSNFAIIFSDKVDSKTTIKEGQICLEEQDAAPDGLGDGPQGAPPGGERRAAAAAEDDG
jgi:hypothetical protein